MSPHPEWIERRPTKAGLAFAEKIIATEYPVISNFELFQLLRDLYKNGQGLYLRSNTPTREDLARVKKMLRRVHILDHDRDYGVHFWRVADITDRAADEIVCRVDPFAYISHQSAMARYGLTDRRPVALFFTTPTPARGRSLVQKKMEEAYGKPDAPDPHYIVPFIRPSHPKRVRGQRVEIHHTSYPGRSQQIRGTFARISTIGQTFADSVTEPGLCGGIRHVIDVWREHARTFLEEVIPAIDDARTSIAVVRAGYILDEVLGIEDPRIDEWTRKAQRGSSRLLDPTKPFVDIYSEKWMISINV